jgi:uncharacterized protein DUF1905
MAEFDFTGTVIEWRGPAPYHFVALPDWVAEQVAQVARAVTYGWGVIPVEAAVGRTTWTTSLFPREGGYLLPVKDAVRNAETIGLGDTVAITLRIRGL